MGACATLSNYQKEGKVRSKNREPRHIEGTSDENRERELSFDVWPAQESNSTIINQWESRPVYVLL